MDKQTAQVLMDALREVGARLNDVAAIIETISDDAEKKALRRPLGLMMGSIYTDFQVPIIRQYGDLDPDKDADWYKEMVARRPHSGDETEGDV
jgi:hypothetical protein